MELASLLQRISLDLLIPHPSNLNLPYPGCSQGSVPVTAHAGGRSFVLVAPMLNLLPVQKPNILHPKQILVGDPCM